MIRKSITNALQEDIGDIVDVDYESNQMLYFEAENTNPCSISLTKISRTLEECDGVYLKWKNSFGAFQEWLFFKAYERNLKTKSIGSVQRQVSNRATAKENFASLGKRAFVEWTLQSYVPFESDAQRKEVETILYSPCIELYLSKRFSGGNKWLRVEIKNESNKTLEKSLVANEFEVTIILPELNTLSI